MISRLAVSATLILSSFLCGAQKILIEAGLHGGANFNLVGQSAASRLTGFVAGGNINLKIKDNFNIKAILQYDEAGWAYRSLVFENSAGTGLEKGDLIRKLSYLNLPLLAEYTTGNKIRFSAGAGVFVGILLNDASITKTLNPVTNAVTTTRSNSAYYRKVNYGLSVGVGAQLPLSPRISLNLNLRDNAGLANLYKPGTIPGKLRTNFLSLSSGFTCLL